MGLDLRSMSLEPLGNISWGSSQQAEVGQRMLLSTLKWSWNWEKKSRQFVGNPKVYFKILFFPTSKWRHKLCHTQP